MKVTDNRGARAISPVTNCAVDCLLAAWNQMQRIFAWELDGKNFGEFEYRSVFAVYMLAIPSIYLFCRFDDH